jgi:hypothetical protein
MTMNIEMAPEIWALMGISVASAAGAVMIKGTKEAKKPDSRKVARATIDLKRRGLLQTNSSPTEAKFSDMFKGEELTEYAYVDISKVQMFFFTIAALIGYIRVLWVTTISPDAEGIIMFPMLSPSIVTLIGISHAGYLTVKSTPKTPSI